MRLLILGDCHLRVRPPQSRTDADFMQSCLGKLRQAITIAEGRGCGAILQVGDFFDSPNPSGELIVEVIRLLKTRISDNPRVLAIHGQHDLAYHTEASTRRSSLAILDASGCLTVIGKEPIRIDGVTIYGVSFGQTPPRPSPEGGYNILVAHAMVGDKPLWPGHDLSGPEEYVRKYPGYDLYCLGDYHYPFSARVGGAWVINPGCLLRLTASDRDVQHKPKVVVFDTDENEFKDVQLDVEPADSVFSPSDRQEKQDGPDFSELVEQLKSAGEIGTSFEENLVRYFEAKKISENIQKTIWNVLEDV